MPFAERVAPCSPSPWHAANPRRSTRRAADRHPDVPRDTGRVGGGRVQARVPATALEPCLDTGDRRDGRLHLPSLAGGRGACDGLDRPVARSRNERAARPGRAGSGVMEKSSVARDSGSPSLRSQQPSRAPQSAPEEPHRWDWGRYRFFICHPCSWHVALITRRPSAAVTPARAAARRLGIQTRQAVIRQLRWSSRWRSSPYPLGS